MQHTRRLRKIIGISLKSCDRAMRQWEKYRRFSSLCHIALKWSNETKKLYRPCMPTSAINFIVLNYQSDESIRTVGHQTLK